MDLESLGFECFSGCRKQCSWTVPWFFQSSKDPLEIIQAQLLASWEKEAKSERSFRMVLRSSTSADEGMLTVSVRGADNLNSLVGACLKKDSWQSGGVSRCQFLVQGQGGSILAVFGMFSSSRTTGSDEALRLDVADGRRDDILNTLQSWTIASTLPLSTSLPEEVAQEARRIATAKSLELKWKGDGNNRCCPLYDIEGNALQCSSLRASLYEGHGVAAIGTPEQQNWICAVCLCRAGDESGESPYVELQCGHTFHRRCIQPWFRRCSRGSGNFCPMGRCFVTADAMAASRLTMRFSLASSAWARLPENVIAEDHALVGQMKVWELRELRAASNSCVRPLVPHKRARGGWKGFREADFNTKILWSTLPL